MKVECVNCSAGRFEGGNCKNCGITIMSTFSPQQRENIKAWIQSKYKEYNDPMANQTLKNLCDDLDKPQEAV